MQDFMGLRLAAVAALFLGSVYVLLPTFLQEDLETRLAASTEQITSPAPKPKLDLDVDFAVRDGEAAAAGKALEARLSAGGVGVSRVLATDGKLKVMLAPGTRSADVVRLASRRGEVALFPAEALPAAGDVAPEVPPAITELVAALGADPSWGARIALAARTAPAEGQIAVPGALTSVAVSDVGVIGASLEGGVPAGQPFLAVAVDGVLEALVVPDADRVRVEPLPRLDDADLAAILAGGSLTASLEEIPEATAPVAEAPKETVAPTPSRVPAWLLGMLPNTRMNLGLDLQGGVDLTLQVGLEEAVLATVGRDATRIKDAAARKNLEFVAVRADRSSPVIWIEGGQELAAIQQFVRETVGIEYTYDASEGSRHGFLMAEARQEEVQEQAVDQVLETLRKRIDATGVKEPSITRKGAGQINVQLPGEVDLEAAVEALGTTAVLEFRMVDEEFDDAVLDKILQAAQQALPADQYADDVTLNHWLWDTDRLAEERIVLFEYEQHPDGSKTRSYPLVHKNEVVLTGNDVASAGVSWDQNQQPYVGLDFKPRGGRIFCEVTTANVGKRFGIVLDGELMSAPSIREAICGGSARIDMGGSVDPMKDAQNLSLVLRTGSLDAPVDIGSVTTIGASLGNEAIRGGSMAAVLGGLLVVTFMAVWYRTSGWLANAALLLNVLLVLATLAMFGATLTLPGIAGIALTAGMAVDSNIIIFERIREELRLGVLPRKAVDTGFERGVEAVLDANITTAIAGIVLYSYGTGPIKGFAVTLLVGIVTTLVTALYVTRTLMDLITRNSAARLRI